MITKEENDRLARTCPGTPCGELMRRYWQPVCRKLVEGAEAKSAVPE